ncbi:ketopantoate reductase family protein [Halobacillus massiliensis]|uniref:ketopantoate reductase family protein n=1 Tax=Halobacillus massiliensis TaxID=1926286 RepID=UPI0009E46425|nr:2-dehydropantoate 2-reductase [Halobacillus massiliensis]
MRIAVLGAGSLGIIIGALIKKGGYKVDLIDINSENVEALNQNGARVTGFLEETIPVSAIHPEHLSHTYDLVFLLTKQVYTEDSLTAILPFLHKESIVCTLQNGVPEEKVAALVGSNRTMGGVVGFGATWSGPGVSELTTELHIMKKYAFDVGELDGKPTARVHTVKKILDKVGHCEITTNIQGVKWSKLLMNATFSGMSAALGCTFGDVLNNAVAMKSLANIADETIKVARSHHVELENMQGKDFRTLELQSQEDVKDKLEFYQEVWGPHANLKASMLQDLEKGRTTEISYINGYIAKKGEQTGIETPFNDLVVQLVKKAEEETKLPVFKENITKFEHLLESYASAFK